MRTIIHAMYVELNINILVTLLYAYFFLGLKQQNDYDRTSLEHKARKVSGGMELFQTVLNSNALNLSPVHLQNM